MNGLARQNLSQILAKRFEKHLVDIHHDPQRHGVKKQSFLSNVTARNLTPMNPRWPRIAVRGAAINTVAPKASDRLICSLIVFISAKPDLPSYTVGVMYSTYDALYMIAALAAALGEYGYAHKAPQKSIFCVSSRQHVRNHTNIARTASTSPAGTP